MKSLKILLIALAANLAGIDLSASSVQDQLVGSIWSMQRQTGLGRVITVWVFNNDGSGVSFQKVRRGNRTESHTHNFSYSTKNNQVIVQEQVAKEWEGLVGVTRWRLENAQLKSEVKFRQETPTFTPIEK